MKKIILLVLLLTFLPVFLNCGAVGYLNPQDDDRYYFFGSDKEMDHYLDTKTLKVTFNEYTKLNDVYDVWLKFVYSEEGRKKHIKDLRSHNLKTVGYENLDHKLIHYKFRYSTNEVMILQYVDYSRDSSILENFTYPAYLQKWDAIVPGSNAEGWLRDIMKYRLDLLLSDLPNNA